MQYSKIKLKINCPLANLMTGLFELASAHTQIANILEKSVRGYVLGTQFLRTQGLPFTMKHQKRTPVEKFYNECNIIVNYFVKESHTVSSNYK